MLHCTYRGHIKDKGQKQAGGEASSSPTAQAKESRDLGATSAASLIFCNIRDLRDWDGVGGSSALSPKSNSQEGNCPGCQTIILDFEQ